MPAITSYPTLVGAVDGDEWVAIVDTPSTAPTLKKVSVANLWPLSGYNNLVIKGADTSKASDITLAADPDLLFNLLANTKYQFEMGLYVVTTTAPDWKHQLYAPAGASIIYHTDVNSGSAINAAGSEATTNVQDNSAVYTNTAMTVAYVLLTGTVITAGTAGNFGIQWAQNTSSATATAVKAGSFLRLHRATV